MINKPPPCKGLNIPIIIPIKGMGFINHRSWIPEIDLNQGSQGYRLQALSFNVGFDGST